MITKEALMEQAKEALKHAYCPYSKFPVGAAILYRDGRVITGANIENVSFGATSCAERSALFAGASMGYRKGDLMAIAIAGKTEDFLPPCNICRQALVEFCLPTMPVYLLNGLGEILSLELQDLVPYSFTSLSM
ncbi:MULTISPECIES: cytidine deaminase [unclassified Granulicatella]|uniref:cytidine deaminase n=1 Tax=unclassified Granulicatella TaxID=2630493 RepID=UPI001073E9E8|nr:MULTISPECIES: cytidine deaminase [unclassified Granulicatella]MBF0779697.1 cytidine deaminase [Granulicatella sp. 19428wC4_WM01]TFU96219.1 cytidine deaminase [Granulicatella sp. WM01]